VPLHADQLGPPDGNPVVLVHGFTQTGRSWAPLLPRLVEQGHRAITVDAPGHGDSTDEADADLVAGGDLLAAAAPRPSTYVGYSMGGRLALHAAIGHPRDVTALVLVGATAGLDTEDERATRRAADEALAAALEGDGLDAFLARWLANPLFATLTAEQLGLDDRRRNTVAGLAASLRRTGTGSQRPRWADLGALTMPALLVAGERDEKFTALAHRLANAWGGPATVRLIAGAGHACHLEQPDAFLDAVLPFLDAHRTDRPAASSTP
jgi:2-succinyl-6-hydroxy-2,4-cyclohexadiene-1-carboxylate synthase